MLWQILPRAGEGCAIVNPKGEVSAAAWLDTLREDAERYDYPAVEGLKTTPQLVMAQELANVALATKTAFGWSSEDVGRCIGRADFINDWSLIVGRLNVTLDSIIAREQQE